MKHWTDDYIKKIGDKFMTYDEKGDEHMEASTIEEARHILEVYSKQIQSNCESCNE